MGWWQTLKWTPASARRQLPQYKKYCQLCERIWKSPKLPLPIKYKNIEMIKPILSESISHDFCYLSFCFTVMKTDSLVKNLNYSLLLAELWESMLMVLRHSLKSKTKETNNFVFWIYNKYTQKKTPANEYQTISFRIPSETKIV